MSHTSPATMLVWAIMSSLLGIFLIHHLWSFDRFRCLKWNDGPYSGAFKRVMTYSYLLSVPLLMTYSLMFAVMKYEEGYTFILGFGIVPTPYTMWPLSYQNAIFPLYLLFSVAWSLEMVTHLEELCFWLFLVNAGAAQQDWFRSAYFRTWAIGSVIAVIYMPLVTSLTLANPLKCEAYTFLAGSLGSLTLTLWFLPILWTFPSFLRNIKADGVDTQVIVRLTKFHELNMIRVLFRFLFVLPLLTLAIDGIMPHEHVNESMFWTDLLAMIAAVGCVVSSAITLVIFFPRSIESEIQAREVTKFIQSADEDADEVTLADIAMKKHRSHQDSASYLMSAREPLERPRESFGSSQKIAGGPSGGIAWASAAHPRDLANDDPEPIIVAKLTAQNVETHNKRVSTYSHFVHNYTSPINLIDRPVNFRRSENV